MSDVIDRAITELNAKLGDGFDGSAMFVIEDEGTIVVDEQGARAGDVPTEVTLTADAETFHRDPHGRPRPDGCVHAGPAQGRRRHVGSNEAGSCAQLR